jgi:AraC-like DNA-binding protein
MDNATPGRLSFSTDALPQRDRFPAFCEEIVRRFTGLDLKTQDQANFHATVQMQRAGAIGIGRVSTSVVDTVRTVGLMRDGDDSILVALVRDGNAYQTQHGHHRLAPGDGVVCDCGYPGELNFITESQFWDIRIPRRKLAALLPSATRFAGSKLESGRITRLLFGYLDTAFGLGLSADPRTAELIGDHVVDLIALALGAEGTGREAAQGRGARAARRTAILREIARRSSDPDLNAIAIAAKLGVTPRYVHLLLEETGKSFTHHLLEKRLEEAAALLRDPRWRDRRIADVALAAGFTDLSYFSRAFRRRFGATASDVRNSN